MGIADSSAGDATLRVLVRSLWWCIKMIFTWLPRLIRYIIKQVKAWQAAKAAAKAQENANT